MSSNLSAYRLCFLYLKNIPTKKTTAKKISDTEYKQPVIYSEKVTKLNGDGSTAINTSIMEKNEDGTYTYYMVAF